MSEGPPYGANGRVRGTYSCPATRSSGFSNDTTTYLPAGSFDSTI